MRTILLFAAVALVSCTFMSCGSKEPDMTALKKTVDEYNAASKDAMMNGNSEKVLAYYEDDAMEMAPNMPMAKGKEAIRAMQQGMMKSGMKFKNVEFNSIDVQAGGKIAFEVGTYAMALDVPDMGVVNDKGKYVALWREQADGSWKVYAETWNTDTPMPPPQKVKATKPNSKKSAVTKKGNTKSKASAKKSTTKKKSTSKKSTKK